MICAFTGMLPATRVLATIPLWSPKYLGAWRALNLDGGGSSVMVAKGDVVSRPVGGHERSVSSAIIVTKP